MDLEEMVSSIAGFSGWSHADKIRFFAWFLHSKKGVERFNSLDIRKCYQSLGLDEPTSISPFLTSMEKKRPRELIKSAQKFSLEKRVRDEFEKKYGHRGATVQVVRLLSDLPKKVPNVAERVFLEEALVCFKYGAFRAAIVMTWNLAYDHLCDYVLNRELTTFNTRWPIRYPNHHKKGTRVISTKDDFAELKESEMIEICSSANIISNSVYKILAVKLGIRNSAAHPSTFIITQLQAEDFISDLINNVVLKYV